ncbi:MAG: nickel-dependent lactate racemase [Spirochaetes bacterium]|uniref:Nickel-dependent lactate racemase n=1 Tax=Candidatus Ornithospirochaeta stercoravium TaxID=2840897 RepID=A0A9D9I9A4_9SPIO|nr:nickel-dependent lactate racemase [Candidatus Ornithospirochaeta stercoravium]
MKKNYQFRYGNTTVTLPIEENQVIGVIEGNETPVLDDIEGELYKVLDNPIESAPLSEVASKASSIAIIVSDMTRFWMRQDIIVPLLVRYLVEKCGRKYEDLEIIIATGTHVGGSEEELRTLVTSDIYDKVKTINHDCRADGLVYLGTTSYGTPVKVNKDAADADLVICLGAATYHVMAGFGGGRKSILPGISSLETIKHNHAYSLAPDKFITNPEIGNGVLDGNPLNEDMLEAAAMMKNLFMVTLVTDTEFRLSSIFAGHWRKSWEAACEEVRRIYRVPVKEKADVVITSCGGFPKDESLYQGTKAVDNVISALKDGGTLVLLLEGRNGGGSPDYFDWIKPLVNGTFEKELRENFTVGGYIFFLNCEQAARFNILMYSSIPAETVAPMGIKSYDNLDKLMEDAHLEGKSIYVIPTGSTVLPDVIG